MRIWVPERTRIDLTTFTQQHLYFSAQDDKLALRSWLIIIFLSLTVPVTTILLARTELFRCRTAGGGGGDWIPPALNQATTDAVLEDKQR